MRGAFTNIRKLTDRELSRLLTLVKSERKRRSALKLTRRAYNG